MRVVDTRTDDVPAILNSRKLTRDAETERIVAEIIADVRARGDEALLDNARSFDAPGLSDIHLSFEDLDRSRFELSPAELEAHQTAFTRIFAFHAAQWQLLRSRLNEPPENHSILGKPRDAIGAWVWGGSFRPGKSDTGAYGQRYVPMESVAIYVPGGNAAYPSTVMMNAAPAFCAGVGRIYAATPARRDGSLHAAVRFSIGCSKIRGTIKVGGAAAIAAYALGTETVPRVDKIVGPGNRFVVEAKRQLWGEVGFDGLNGPSEVCVLADDDANASFAAADLLTQVEHAPDNVGYLVCLSDAKVREILGEVERQLKGAPRSETMRQALEGDSLAVVARDPREALEIANLIAPEHLSLNVREPEGWMAFIRNAGCILIGDYTPESAADYVIGPSHTLPTGRAARWQSALNVLDFIKVQSWAYLTESDLASLIPAIETFGDMEGFPAHARGATIRRRD